MRSENSCFWFFGLKKLSLEEKIMIIFHQKFPIMNFNHQKELLFFIILDQIKYD